MSAPLSDRILKNENLLRIDQAIDVMLEELDSKDHWVHKLFTVINYEMGILKEELMALLIAYNETQFTDKKLYLKEIYEMHEQIMFAVILADKQVHLNRERSGYFIVGLGEYLRYLMAWVHTIRMAEFDELDALVEELKATSSTIVRIINEALQI